MGSQYRLSSNSCGPNNEEPEEPETRLNTALAVTLVVIIYIYERKNFCLNTTLAVTLVVIKQNKEDMEEKKLSQYRLSSNSCGHMCESGKYVFVKVSIPP